MKQNYLKNSHNKVFMKNKFVYKFFKSDKKYLNEKFFYLNYKIKNIPKLISFSDSRRLLIFNNVGSRIRKKDLNVEKLKIINEYFIKNNVYHNDFRVKNILYNKKDNTYYWIDFEYWDTHFTDYRKSKVSDDLRDLLFNII